MQLRFRGWNRKQNFQYPFDKPLEEAEERSDHSIIGTGCTNPVQNGIEIGFKATNLKISPNAEYMVTITLTKEDIRTIVERCFGPNARIKYYNVG